MSRGFDGPSEPGISGATNRNPPLRYLSSTHTANTGAVSDVPLSACDGPAMACHGLISRALRGLCRANLRPRPQRATAHAPLEPAADLGRQYEAVRVARDGRGQMERHQKAARRSRVADLSLHRGACDRSTPGQPSDEMRCQALVISILTWQILPLASKGSVK